MRSSIQFRAACLRIGGASTGADEMVDLARANGKHIYFSLEEVPLVTA